ncbi:hypothetical protein DVH05_014060 [Phytophthora capsici]|nr:hypothetical protein DVH05_014060 [Phytophthora capsici]
MSQSIKCVASVGLNVLAFSFAFNLDASISHVHQQLSGNWVASEQAADQSLPHTMQTSLHSLALPREEENHLLNALEALHVRHVVERTLLVHPASQVGEFDALVALEAREPLGTQCKVLKR